LIRQNVEHIFPQYSSELEGVFTSPYCDVRRLVSAGVGFLCDPIERCIVLDWWIGDRRATISEITNDWHALKDRALRMTDEQMQHWTAQMQAPLTSIRLKQEAIERLTIQKLHANYDYIEKHLIPSIGSAPADAQLGAMSLAWAVGAGFDMTNPPRTEFVKAFEAGDWQSAKAHARLRETGNRGVTDRNRRQELCFDNATTVVARGLDPAALWWPNACPKEDSLHTLAVHALELGIARGDEKA
jgi:hypothetical protein